LPWFTQRKSQFENTKMKHSILNSRNFKHQSTTACIFLSLFMGAFGGGYRLFPHDRERLLQFLNKCREELTGPNWHKLVWDETYHLGKVAGLEASCAMIGASSISWEWKEIIRYSPHLKHFLSTDDLPNGLLGYTETTRDDPRSTEWLNLKTIMTTQWIEDLSTAMPLILMARKVGCSVRPNCHAKKSQLNSKVMETTVLVCVFSPGNGLIKVDEGPSCDCDYHPGGCIISKAPPIGYWCHCTESDGTCDGRAEKCVSVGWKCPENCRDFKCCVLMEPEKAECSRMNAVGEKVFDQTPV